MTGLDAMTARIEWPVRRSLAGYVRSLGDGYITVAGGAEAEGDAFCFPIVDVECATSITLRTRGWVRFVGHGGLLNLHIANPALEISGRTGQLSIDFPWASTGSNEPIVIATAHFGSDVVPHQSSTAARVYLTEDGSELFGNYRGGDEMDGLRVMLTDPLSIVTGI